MAKNSLVEEIRGDPAGPEHKASFTWLHDLYRVLWKVAGPLLPAYLRRRARRGKEDPQRMTERFGVPSRARPDGDLLWIHGASVGESLSALPLAERLLKQRPELFILVTTGTLTSATLLASRLPSRAFHQYVPLDHPDYARKFLDHWKPQAVFWLESEFWPNLLGEITSRNIPAALVNSRLSDRSFRRWQRMPRTIAQILNTFRLALPKDDDVARKLSILGSSNTLDIRCEGNLKLASLPLPDKEDDRLVLEREIGSRPFIIAAQTVEGEEDLLARVFQNLQIEFPDLLLIIVPKHPTRAPEIETTLSGHGLSIATRSKNEMPGSDIQTYLADTMGELGLFFRLDGPVVLGRSLVPGFGGSNPLEPARFGRCIIQGPHTINFGEVTEMFSVGKASLVASSETELGSILKTVLEDREMAQQLGTAAKTIVQAAQSVLERYEEALMPLLPKSPEHKKGDTDARS